MSEPDSVHLAARVAAIQPFHVMALMARARALETQGRSIIHMEIGEPDFGTAGPVLAAGQRALAAGYTRYTPAAGIPALREAIADHYRRRYGVTVAAERIVVTPGASGALQLVTAVLVDPGEQVLMTDPGYPCNRHFVRLVEGEPVGIPVAEDSAYQLSVELLQRYWSERTVAVLLASPANPTGTLVPQDSLAAMIDFVAQHGARIIIDEIYHGLTYEKDVATALAASAEVFVVNSFSKYFGMTGWRLGWTVVPQAYVGAVEKLAQNLFLAPSTPAQYAALAAFEAESIRVFEGRRKQFQERRDYLLAALKALGCYIPLAPDGAFYLYADCSRFTDDSYQLALDLMEHAGVAITPGIDFGSYRARRHVRFAYTTSLDNLAEGVQRLGRYLC